MLAAAFADRAPAQPIEGSRSVMRPFRVTNRALLQPPPSGQASLRAGLDGIDGLEQGTPVVRVRVTNAGTVASDPAARVVISSDPVKWPFSSTEFGALGPSQSTVVSVTIPATLSPGDYPFRASITLPGIDGSTTAFAFDGVFTVPAPVDLWVGEPSLDPGVVGSLGRLVIPIGNNGPAAGAGATVHVAGGAYWKDQDVSAPDLLAGQTANVSVVLDAPIARREIAYAVAIRPGPTTFDRDASNDARTGTLSVAQAPYDVALELVSMSLEDGPPVFEVVVTNVGPGTSAALVLAVVADGAELLRQSVGSLAANDAVRLRLHSASRLAPGPHAIRIALRRPQASGALTAWRDLDPSNDRVDRSIEIPRALAWWWILLALAAAAAIAFLVEPVRNAILQRIWPEPRITFYPAAGIVSAEPLQRGERDSTWELVTWIEASDAQATVLAVDSSEV